MSTPIVIPCSRCDRPHTPPLPVRCIGCGESFVRCPSCKYDLADSPDGRCPECGVAFARLALLEAIVIECTARQETWNQRVHSVAVFFGALVSFALLIATCAFSPPLAIAVALLVLVAWLSAHWRLKPQEIVLLAMGVIAVPTLLYGVVLLIDGLSTLARGSHYWTSFDVLTPTGLRPMIARRVVVYGATLTTVAGILLVLLVWRVPRSLRNRVMGRPSTSASPPPAPPPPRP